MAQWFAVTDAGKVRPRNEDRFRIAEDLNLYLLADGMGGARGGARASQLAVDTVIETFAAQPDRDVPALLESVAAANRKILGESRQDNKLAGMGTTLVAALDRGDIFSIVSVGDSRAYLFREGRLKAITEDQTWVQQVGVPMGLDEDAISQHFMRHVLMMAVGVGESLEVNHYDVPVQKPDMILLSSDGLHGVVPAKQVEAILCEKNGGGREWTVERRCNLLIKAARDAGGPDNITVVLIEI